MYAIYFFSDRKIADHVVKVHQYRDPREADGDVTVVSSAASDLATHKGQQVNAKYTSFLYAIKTRIQQTLIQSPGSTS